MSSFKGNDDNLMQHWVLCELLAVARKYATHLTFVDAHSMAPIAIHRTEKRATRSGRFDAVFENLPGQGSSYEQAWHALSPDRGGYPNSAGRSATSRQHATTKCGRRRRTDQCRRDNPKRTQSDDNRSSRARRP